MPWFEPIRSALLPILQIGYHFLIVATVLCVVALIIAVNSRRFAKLSDAFFKLTHFQRVVAIMCIVIATVYAQKDDGDDGAGAPRMMMAPMVTPTASDVEDLATPTNSALAISGIEVGTNSVALGISWTDALSPTNNCLDLFASWDLLSGKWSHLAEIDLGTASSNIVAEIDFSLYPTNALRTTAFFRIATQADSDGDGLSDMLEEWSFGTDPENPDTDGDGMPDGWEVVSGLDPLLDDSNIDTDLDGLSNINEHELGTNPTGADTDGDGLNDGCEIARIDEDIALPWLTVQPIRTIAVTRNTDSGLYVCQLPFAGSIAGSSIDYAVADVNGVVYLGNASTTNSISSRYPINDALAYNTPQQCALVTGYWTDLRLNATLNSTITFGTASYGDCNYFVIQYDKMEIRNDQYGEASFQILIPDGVNDTVIVKYGTIQDSRANDTICIGAHGHRGENGHGPNMPKLRYAYFTSAAPSISGMAIKYYFGCGGDPFLEDTDGDGLNDGWEVQHGLNPNDMDTDFDGMSDWWEVRNSLNPLSKNGANGADGDVDGDGLENLLEYLNGADPNRADTDGDGLADVIEVGNAVVSNSLPWFDMSNATDVTGLFANNTSSIISLEHYEQTTIKDFVVSNILVDVNGIVYLRRSGDRTMMNPENGERDLAGTIRNSSLITIAPFWCDLILTDTDPESKISVGDCCFDGKQYRIIEYANVRDFYDYRTLSHTISFQLAIPYGKTDRVYVRYGDLSDSYMDGSNASIGFQGYKGEPRRSYCYRQPGRVYSGLALEFVFGFGSNPSVSDSDNDGFSDLLEMRYGTNPWQADTDGDSLWDGWEATYGFDPLVGNDTDDDPDNDQSADPDGDGLTNAEECEWNTNPTATDSDGDGVDDGDEVNQFSDPDDATDGGRPASRAPVSFTFGDQSGSHSEKYRLELKPIAPANQTIAPADMPKTISWVDAEYGECETKTAMLARGFKYEVRLFHAGTNNAGAPDYDYSLIVSPLNGVGVVVNDPEELFRADDMTSDYFSGEGKVATITVLDAMVCADYNRDGKIDDEDRVALYRGQKLRHWINDDDDSGDVSEGDSDVPGVHGRSADCADALVDGRCDLLDFAPVRLDIGHALSQLEDISSNCVFRLVQEDSALKLVWTSLAANDANDFLTTDFADCGEALAEHPYAAHVVAITGSGTIIPETFLDLVRRNPSKGIVMVEGVVESSNPLVLECRDTTSDELVFKIEMPLSISEVGKMFRMKNLRPVCGDNGAFAEQLDVPENNPDTDSNQKNLVFLHGANVTREGATAWFSEVFKRLWQTGANVKFHGVTWYSDKGSDANYQENVSNAFVTASSLASYVNGLSGQRTIMAHSLGNMVVSSAIQDYGMQVYKYLMCNSAVPSEAYCAPEDISIRIPQLVHEDWEEYPTNSWASNWHKLFGNSPNDGRSKLGWPGRFSGVLSNAVNFYSTGDEVLEINSDNDVSVFTGIGDSFGHLSWHKQELFKGRGGLGGTDWSGWSIRKHLLVFADITPEEANGMTDTDFKTNTVFRLEPTNMNSSALTRLQADAHLAQGIPALAPATGRDGLSRLLLREDYVDMNDQGQFGISRLNGWPSRNGTYANQWLHSDIKDVAFYFNYKFYQIVIQKGDLK